MDTAGLDVNRIKQNVSEYWRAEGWNWPVKVMSAHRASTLGASPGRVVAVKGFVTSEKFVRGRSLEQVERILGLLPGELKDGAVLLRLNYRVLSVSVRSGAVARLGIAGPVASVRRRVFERAYLAEKSVSRLTWHFQRQSWRRCKGARHRLTSIDRKGLWIKIIAQAILQILVFVVARIADRLQKVVKIARADTGGCTITADVEAKKETLEKRCRWNSLSGIDLALLEL